MLDYLAVDANWDMVFMTHGNPNIEYGVILSSTVSPYSIDTTNSKIYFDSTSSSTRKIKSIKIVSRSYLKALIIDESTMLAYLANLDLTASTILY
jgi:hypothetical protein